MTQEQAAVELKFRLAKYVLRTLQDQGKITPEMAETARRILCEKYQPFTCCLEEGIPWTTKL